MAKNPKLRIAEQRYIKRTRRLHRTIPKSTRTPWMEFFKSGVGAEIETEIPKTSIRSIVYTYGKKLNKKFICSYEERDDRTLVKLEAVRVRE